MKTVIISTETYLTALRTKDIDINYCNRFVGKRTIDVVPADDMPREFLQLDPDVILRSRNGIPQKENEIQIFIVSF